MNAAGTHEQVDSCTVELPMLGFKQARQKVLDELAKSSTAPKSENVPLGNALGRILDEEILADRDYPPFRRATRDGFAVRAADLNPVPSSLEILGEVKAGTWFEGKIGPGQCVGIMTGAPVPEGADAVVMVEHTRVNGNGVRIDRALKSGDNIVPQGSEGKKGSLILPRGRRLRPGEIGLLASVGKTVVSVARRLRVAILATGDEVVPLEQEPEWFQVRNSNAAALCAQVEAADGIPVPLEVAPDRYEPLRALLEKGLESDLLVLSGGVSMGKYDIVRNVLADLGAEFHFTSVAMRPGKPLVFGHVQGRHFFGLPGNPVSTFVTFELFVRPGMDVLSGAPPEPLTFMRARLGSEVRLKGKLTAFLPARVAEREDEPVVELVGWQGSGDLVGLAAANCFLVAHPDQKEILPGHWVDVLPKGW
ncbi:MAG: molybdopterin molybdotransferase MoeA [Acidobacteria bacterium]|nr:molybdopterin molybdotransferase MoeA [Acidobacteriota bacterium]